MEKVKCTYADINLKLDDVFDGIKCDMRQLFEGMAHYQKENIILKNKVVELENKIKKLTSKKTKGDIR